MNTIVCRPVLNVCWDVSELPALGWTDSDITVDGSTLSCLPQNAFIPGSDVTCSGWCPGSGSWWLQLELNVLYFVVRLDLTTSSVDDDDRGSLEYYTGRQNSSGTEITWRSIEDKVCTTHLPDKQYATLLPPP